MPQTKIKLRHGDTLIVDTLSGTVQLNAIRRFRATETFMHDTTLLCVAARRQRASDQDQAQAWRHLDRGHLEWHSATECHQALSGRRLPDTSSAESPAASDF